MAEARNKRQRVRRIAIFLAYLSLFALSIPWYLPSDSVPPLWLGLPYWVVISVACCVLIAFLNAFVIYKSGFNDEDES